MIEIEMRHDDVAHVARVEAESGDLAEGGELFTEVGVDEREEEPAEPGPRRVHVAKTESRVEQDQTFVGLNEQAVAGEVPAPHETRRARVHEQTSERTGGDAVQMVDGGHASRTASEIPRQKPARLNALW